MNIPKPSDSVLIQLASLIVHIEEACSKDGHAFDVSTIAAYPQNPQIREWVDQFDDVLVPRKRAGDGR